MRHDGRELENSVRIAVLGSGAGSNFSALAKACEDGRIQGEIVIVSSDQAEASILKKAAVFRIPTFIEKGGKEYSKRVAKRLTEASVDLVCLAGLMQIVRTPLLGAFPNRILNIHPSLLPRYPGKEAWKQALEDGASETGCTVHYVDTGIDTGEVILQETVPVFRGDTPETIHARIQEAEYRVYVEAVQQVITECADSDGG